MLGNLVLSSQIAHLDAILAQKDDASYGARPGTRTQAENLLGRLDEFAAWAELELSR